MKCIGLGLGTSCSREVSVSGRGPLLPQLACSRKVGAFQAPTHVHAYHPQAYKAVYPHSLPTQGGCRAGQGGSGGGRTAAAVSQSTPLPPDDGQQFLVARTTHLRGGLRFRNTCPPPLSSLGPFQLRPSLQQHARELYHKLQLHRVEGALDYLAFKLSLFLHGVAHAMLTAILEPLHAVRKGLVELLFGSPTAVNTAAHYSLSAAVMQAGSSPSAASATHRGGAIYTLQQLPPVAMVSRPTLASTLPTKTLSV